MNNGKHSRSGSIDSGFHSAGEANGSSSSKSRSKRSRKRTMTVEERVAEARDASKEIKIKLKSDVNSQRVVEATEYDLGLLETYQTRARFHMYMTYKRRHHFKKHCDKLTSFRRLMFYVIFLIFFTISTIFNFENRLIFTMGAGTTDALLEEEFPDTATHIQKTFFDIGSAEELYQWLGEVFVPQMYTSATSYQDSDVGTLFGQNAIIGGMRVSQLRLQDAPDNCFGLSGELRGKDGAAFNMPCWGKAGTWDDELEDKSVISRDPNGQIKFFHAGGGENFLAPHGRSYSTVEEERALTLGSGGTLTNENIFYPSGAYGVVFPHPTAVNASSDAAKLVQTMIDGVYVARDTRLVSIQFSIYNENIDSFGIYFLYVEFPATGGVNVGNKNNIVRLFSVTAGRTISDAVFEFIVAGLFAWYLVAEIMTACRKGPGIMLQAHNIMNKLNITLYGCMWVFRIASVLNALPKEDVVWNANEYYSLQAPGSLRTIAVSFAAVNAFFCYFRLAHYLSALPQFAVVTGTLYRSIKPCIEFLFVFGVVFFGFVTAHMLIFGQELEGYQNMRDSSYSLLLSLMGDINLESLEQVNAFWGPVFVVLFTLVATFIVLNIFIAIVTEGYEDVRDELARSKRYNLREEFGWYICDRLLRIPTYGKQLDYYARFYFSTIRFKRRVNAQRTKLTRLLQRQGVKLSASGADASVSGLDVYGTDNDDATGECCTSSLRFCGRACPGGRCPAMCGVQEEKKVSVHASLPDINQGSLHGRYGCKLLQQAYPEHYTDTPLRRGRVQKQKEEQLSGDGLPINPPSDALTPPTKRTAAPAGILVGGAAAAGTGSGSSSKRVSIVEGDANEGKDGDDAKATPGHTRIMSTSGSVYQSDEIEQVEGGSPTSPDAVVVRSEGGGAGADVDDVGVSAADGGSAVVDAEDAADADEAVVVSSEGADGADDSGDDDVAYGYGAA